MTTNLFFSCSLFFWIRNPGWKKFESGIHDNNQNPQS
jgi:hypothetical protein